MNRREERIEELRRRGEFDREELAKVVAEIRGEWKRLRSRWKTIGWVAGGLAAGGTVAYKLFGRSSLSAKLGRLASLASFLFGLGRAVGRARRF